MRSSRAQARGFALIFSVLLVLLVAGLGTALLVDATTESRSGAHFRSSTQAFYMARSGLEEARARLLAVSANPITPPALVTDVTYITNGSGVNPTNAANLYYDAEYAAEFPGITPIVAPFVSSVQPSGATLPYRWVRITLKTEASSSQDIDRDSLLNSAVPVYYDGTSQNLTATGRTIYKITALAVLPDGSRSMLQMEGAPPPPFASDSAIASQDDVRMLGNFSVTGVDYCGASSTVYGAKTTQNIDISGNAGTITGLTGPPPNPTGTYQNAPASYNIVSLINSLKPYATPIQQVDATVTYDASTNSYSGSGLNLGTPPPAPPPVGNNGTPVITYVSGNLQLTADSQGDGILIVDGDLDIHGGLYYYGLIVVRGIVSFTGGGSERVNLYGSVVSGSSVTNTTSVGGGVNVQFDSCAVSNPYNSFPLKVVAFREIVNY